MSNVTEVLMPLMGEGVHEAILTNWLVKEGAKVEKDSPLLELSSDKVDTEIAAPASGYLIKILVTKGTTVNVGQVLAHIGGSPDAKAGPSPAPAHSEQASAPLASIPAKPFAIGPDTDSETPLRSSPLVRKIAKDRGIDLRQIEGSGMHGRITKKDILDFADGPAAIPVATPQASPQSKPSPASPLNLAKLGEDESLDGVAVRREPMTRMRQLIADHMVESIRVSPHVTTVFEIDLHRVWKLREECKDSFFAAEGFKLTLTHFFIHAAVQAIKQHPIVNTSVDGYDILWKKAINVGCAVALDNGLIVPVIKNAGDLNLLGIARRMNDLVVRARSKKLKAEDIQGGTFTITNPGGWGSITSNPIINQPQVAILGIGAAVKRPVVIDDMIAIRPMMLMSLTFDHRAIDGEGGARYLATLKQVIENYQDLPL